MIKKNLRIIAITSLITLLPIVAGLILWNSLPDKIATHFNSDGVADGFSSKGFAVFAMPVFLFILHWVCCFVTSLDPKHKNITDKMFRLVLWICPCISVLTSSVVLAFAMNYKFNINIVFSIFFGLMFAVIGNYLPKCKQNYSLGIKIPWTLNDEGNWNYTHRIAGKLWFAGGIFIILTSFLTQRIFFYFFMPVVLLMVIIPVIFSYRYHKKHSENKK